MNVHLAELKHVVKAVSRIQLSDHLVDTVFTLFDENGKFSLAYILKITCAVPYR